MDKQDWTKEPWEHEGQHVYHEADVRRADACVNACAGVPTETLEYFRNGNLGYNLMGPGGSEEDDMWLQLQITALVDPEVTRKLREKRDKEEANEH